jgi:hypothetical protein
MMMNLLQQARRKRFLACSVTFGVAVLCTLIWRVWSQTRKVVWRPDGTSVENVWFVYLDSNPNGVEVWRILPRKGEKFKLCQLESSTSRFPDYVISCAGSASRSVFVRAHSGWHRVSAVSGANERIALPANIPWAKTRWVSLNAPTGEYAFLTDESVSAYAPNLKSILYRVSGIEAMVGFVDGRLLMIDRSHRIVALRMVGNNPKVEPILETGIHGVALQLDAIGRSLAVRTKHDLYLYQRSEQGQYEVVDTVRSQHPVEMAWLDEDHIAFRALMPEQKIGSMTEVRVYTLSTKQTGVWRSSWGLLGCPINLASGR